MIIMPYASRFASTHLYQTYAFKAIIGAVAGFFNCSLRDYSQFANRALFETINYRANFAN